MYARYMTCAVRAGFLGVVAAIGLIPASAQAMPDSLLQDFGSVVRWLHLYSGQDGVSHIEEMPVSEITGPAGLTFLLNKKVEQAAVGYWPDSFSYDWHKPSSRNIGLYLQGTLVIETGDGRQHQITPGTAMLVEDLKGGGHRLRCEAKRGRKVCLFIQLTLPKLKDESNAPAIGPESK